MKKILQGNKRETDHGDQGPEWPGEASERRGLLSRCLSKGRERAPKRTEENVPGKGVMNTKVLKRGQVWGVQGTKRRPVQ